MPDGVFGVSCLTSCFSSFNGFLTSCSTCSVLWTGSGEGFDVTGADLCSGSDGLAFFRAVAGCSGSVGAKTLFPLSPGTITMGLLGGVARGGTQSGVLEGAGFDSFSEGGAKGMSCKSDCRSLFREDSSGVVEGALELIPVVVGSGGLDG